MDNFRIKFTKLFLENTTLKKYYNNTKITGNDPWGLSIELEWKDIGKIKIAPFSLSDFWALKHWWMKSLNYESKKLFPLFPIDENLDRHIANHFKNQETKRDIIFNVWLIKDSFLTEDFENEIIGHFFVLESNSAKPFVGLGISSRFQGKKLGTLFLYIIFYIFKIMNKNVLWLTTGKDNIVGLNLYKKLGFEQTGEIEVLIPSENYKRFDIEMKIDIRKIL
jgi:RimJ/RimL family protein N-acetyltransferase